MDRTSQRMPTFAGRLAAALVGLAAAQAPAGQAPPGASRLPAGTRAYPLDVHKFAVLERDSGPVSYYSIVEDPVAPFIRGEYKPPLETVTVFADVGDSMRHGVERIRFRWRAWVFPVRGDECSDGRGDAAVNVYIVWKRGLRWYSVKLVWSTVGTPGQVCRRIRNPFTAANSVIVRSGGPTGQWFEEEVDPAALYREQFEGGNPNAEVPELQGIGVLTDGDQTHSMAAGDFGGVVLYKRYATASRSTSR